MPADYSYADLMHMAQEQSDDTTVQTYVSGCHPTFAGLRLGKATPKDIGTDDD
jgi:hypothetical protein